jgi:hypothetical protein
MLQSEIRETAIIPFFIFFVPFRGNIQMKRKQETNQKK